MITRSNLSASRRIAFADVRASAQEAVGVAADVLLQEEARACSAWVRTAGVRRAARRAAR